MKRIYAFFIAVGLGYNVLAQSLTNGLIAYYPFDGNLNDARGNPFDGIPDNITYIADHNGVAGKAASFNGSSSKVVTKLRQKGIMECTITAWVKIPAGGGNVIVNSRGSSRLRSGLSLTNKGFGLDGDNALRLIEKQTALPADTWYHLIYYQSYDQQRSYCSKTDGNVSKF